MSASAIQTKNSNNFQMQNTPRIQFVISWWKPHNTIKQSTCWSHSDSSTCWMKLEFVSVLGQVARWNFLKLALTARISGSCTEIHSVLSQYSQTIITLNNYVPNLWSIGCFLTSIGTNSHFGYASCLTFCRQQQIKLKITVMYAT